MNLEMVIMRRIPLEYRRENKETTGAKGLDAEETS
jgi:hypothetical protein